MVDLCVSVSAGMTVRLCFYRVIGASNLSRLCFHVMGTLSNSSVDTLHPGHIPTWQYGTCALIHR